MKSKKYKYLIISLILMSLMMNGCENKENIEFTDWPIIEAYLHDGYSFGLKVSRQVPFLEDAPYSEDDIDDLTITVTFNDSDYVLHSTGEGEYADTLLPLVAHGSYTLSMMFNSREVTAYTYIPEKPEGYTQSATSISVARMDSTSTPISGGMDMPDPIDMTWENSDDSYYLLVIENIEDTLDPIRDFGDEDPPENIFRKQPTTSTSERVGPMEFQYFGTHRLILYHVLPDYAALYEGNSNSSQSLENPSTSISNGYGIFTGLNSDTLFVEVIEAK